MEASLWIASHMACARTKVATIQMQAGVGQRKQEAGRQEAGDERQEAEGKRREARGERQKLGLRPK